MLARCNNSLHKSQLSFSRHKVTKLTALSPFLLFSVNLGRRNLGRYPVASFFLFSFFAFWNSVPVLVQSFNTNVTEIRMSSCILFLGILLVRSGDLNDGTEEIPRFSCCFSRQQRLCCAESYTITYKLPLKSILVVGIRTISELIFYF